MIITEKNKKIVYTQEDDDLTKEKAKEILKNIKISPELKSKTKL